MGTQYVVLNSFKATKDLLEKQSGITSNRPHFTVAGDLIGWGSATGFLQYGDTHRKHRKLFGQHMRTKRSVVRFYPAEEAEAKQFVRDVLKDPDDLIAHCRRYVHRLLSSCVNVTYFGQNDCVIDLEDIAWL